MNDELEKT